MIQQTVNSLYQLMRPHFRGFPGDYFVLDIETTGTRFHNGAEHYDGDLITELGFCHVKDSKPLVWDGLTLNWYLVPSINKQALTERLQATKRQVEFDKVGAPTGKKYHMTPELMQKDGADPVEVLKTFSQMLHEARQHQHFFVAHNGYHFDARFLESHFAFWAKEPFKFADNELFDTGMVEKGSQANLTPWPGDTIRTWSDRTYANRLKGIKWSLDKNCVPRYKLDERYNLDTAKAHSAGYDCYVTHLLFEEFKAIATGEREEPPCYVQT